MSGLRGILVTVLLWVGSAYAGPDRYLLPPSELFPSGGSRISALASYLHTASRGKSFDSPRVYCREVANGSEAYKIYHRAARDLFDDLIIEVGAQEGATGLYRVLFEYDDYIVSQTVEEMRTSRFHEQTVDEIAEFMYNRVEEVYSRVYSQHELYQKAKRRTSLAVWSSLMLLADGYLIYRLHSIPGTEFDFLVHSTIIGTGFLLFLRVLWNQRVIPYLPDRVEEALAELLLPDRLKDPIVLQELRFDRKMDLSFERWHRKLMRSVFYSYSPDQQRTLRDQLRSYMEPHQKSSWVRNFRKVVEFALANNHHADVEVAILILLAGATRKDAEHPAVHKNQIRKISSDLIAAVRNG